MRQGWARWLALGAIGLAILAALIWFAETAAGLDSRDDRIHLVYNIILLLLLVAAGAVHWQRRPTLVLGHALTWLAVGAVLILGYSFRFELKGLGDRLVSELSPPRGRQAGPGSVSFPISWDGHFHVDASVGGTVVRMMVDTGATVVVLSRADAERIGLDLDALVYSIPFSTANGTVMGAPVRLREIRIGPIAVRDVHAAVTSAPMDQSLLGQSFLQRLSGYTVRGATLTMHR